MTDLKYSGGAAATTLASGITNADLTIALVDASTWPSTGAFTMTLARGLAGEEKILVASRSGNTLTVTTRGYDGTSAAAHLAGVAAEHTASATAFQEYNDHQKASAAVHGLTGTVVGTTDTQTLTNKTLTTPTIGDHTNANHTHASAAQGGSLALVGCRLTRSTAQSIPTSTLTAVTFDTEQYDTDGFHSTVTNTDRITIPAGKAGKYLIHASLGWAGGGTGRTQRAAQVFLNGTAVFVGEGSTYVTDTETAVTTVSTVYNLAVGDYLNLQAYQTSGSALNVSVDQMASPSFGVTYLGA